MKHINSIWIFLLLFACVDRFYDDIRKPLNPGIGVSGFISDQPGPYEVKIYNIFDIESKESTKTPVVAKRLVIRDSEGHEEELTSSTEGIYHTKPDGIRGKVGGIYTLRIELFNGSVYESQPDTILATADHIDRMYINYESHYNIVGEKRYGFDVYFDASYSASTNNRFMWTFEGTYKADTHPEISEGLCYYTDGKCNFVPLCSGYVNVGTTAKPNLVKKYDCTCCTCWYSLFNDNLILSDDLYSLSGQLTGVHVKNIPLNEWTLYTKVRLEITQESFTEQSFQFWRAIRDQKEALGNIFQPITGHIPTNFRQVSGDEFHIAGLFYATSISRRTRYVSREDLPPNFFYVVPFEKPVLPGDCRDKFPHSSNVAPTDWID